MSVLVTGAAGAIGSACVEAFLDQGEQVIVHDLDVSSWSNREGVVTASGDLLATETLAELTRVAAETSLRAVVAAHGIAGSSALPDCDERFIERVMAINWATIPALYDALGAVLALRHGAFVAIASQAALGGESENTVYCAAKFAVNGWIEAQAEAATGDVTFHSICPGATNSALLIQAQTKFALAQGITPEQYYAERARQIALGRYGEPAEMGAAAVYLTTPGPRPTVLAVTGGDVLL